MSGRDEHDEHAEPPETDVEEVLQEIAEMREGEAAKGNDEAGRSTAGGDAGTPGPSAPEDAGHP